MASSLYDTISFASPKIFWILGSTKFVNIHPIPPRLAGAGRGRAAVFILSRPEFILRPIPIPKMRVWMNKTWPGPCAHVSLGPYR